MNARTLITLGLLSLSLLPGCSKLTLENYDRIAVGMPYDEVTDLIGDPDACTDLMGVRSCRWGDEKRSITVNFIKGKAVIFSSRNLQ